MFDFARIQPSWEEKRLKFFIFKKYNVDKIQKKMRKKRSISFRTRQPAHWQQRRLFRSAAFPVAGIRCRFSNPIGLQSVKFKMQSSSEQNAFEEKNLSRRTAHNEIIFPFWNSKHSKHSKKTIFLSKCLNRQPPPAFSLELENFWSANFAGARGKV